MQYYHNFKEIQLNSTAVACGKFDGIHKGHQALLWQLRKYQEKGLKSAVFTFDSSIISVMSDKLGFIYTSEERRFILEQTGVDYLAEYVFDSQLSRMEPEQFVKQILVEQMGAKVIVVGEDFRFGYQRQGNVHLLKELKTVYDYQLVVVEKQMDGTDKISSSRIREQIAKGHVKQAAQWLGRPYFILGKVIHGRQLGRTIGMPTANIAVPEGKLIPPKGVYVSCNYIGNEKYYGISNIGRKPTVQGETLGVETFLFDFSKDIYGKDMRVEFLDFVRPEQKFDSIAALSEQMHKDALFGREYTKGFR